MTAHQGTGAESSKGRPHHVSLGNGTVNEAARSQQYPPAPGAYGVAQKAITDLLGRKSERA